MSETQKILDRVLAEVADEGLPISDAYTSSPPSTVNALSSVLNYIITDAFNLSAEESVGISYNLGIIFTPLHEIFPSVTLGAVKQEMMTGEYSARLFRRTQTGSSLPSEANVKYASVEDWVESLSEVVLTSYPDLRPMISSSIVGALHGLLTELGVSSNPRKSRASLYLPNSVRYLLNNRR